MQLPPFRVYDMGAFTEFLRDAMGFSKQSAPLPHTDEPIPEFLAHDDEARKSDEEYYYTPEKYLDGDADIPGWYGFQSNMVLDEDLKPGMLRCLEVDKRLTLPTRTHIRFLITAGDVIHSFNIPSLGIKQDAVPGRLARINTFILREGVFYGQCTELCGTLHAYMPIVVEAVSPARFAAHAKKWYVD